MLIEAARRFEAAAKEMLSAMNGSSVSCDEARQVLAVCKSAAAALAATQSRSSVRSGRGSDATEAQRQILLARYGGCFHCKAHPALCQIHHIRPVSQGGSTRLDNMVPVCWDCHQKIHHHKWRIRTTNGVHTLHPPGQVHYGPACAPEEPILHLPGIATDGLLAGAVPAGG